MNNLYAGESLEMIVLPGLSLVVRNNGWTLEVVCKGGNIGIIPVNGHTVTIIAKSEKAVDDVLGIEH